MTTALRPHAHYLLTLWTAGLLCHVCEEQPWTQAARWCTALICAACAQGEPYPDDDLNP